MASSSEKWTTAIARVDESDVIVRGHRLSELVGEVGFVDVIFLVLTGELPSDGKRRTLDAIMVSTIEHGISPTTILARTLASCGTPVQASMAGGMLSIADSHGGSSEQLAVLLRDIVSDSTKNGSLSREDLHGEAARVVAEYRARKQRFEGFGHPQHVDGDPRARMLLDKAEQFGTSGNYVEALHVLSEEIEASLGRPLKPNVTGALAALVLDLGFSAEAVRGLVIASRSPGLLAHIIEEKEQGGVWRHAPADVVEYTGPEPSLAQM